MDWVFNDFNVVLAFESGFQAFSCLNLVLHLMYPLDGCFINLELKTEPLGEEWERDRIEGPEMSTQITIYHVIGVSCVGSGRDGSIIY